jgi:hypothetical protein
MRTPRGTSALIVLLCAAVAAAAVAGVTGCGDDSGGTEQATTGEPAEGGEGPEEPAAVPASLGTVESGAEDTVDFAHRSDRAAVVRTARKVLRAARGRAASDLRAAGVDPGQIAALQQRARRLERIAADASFADVSLAANAVSGLMPALYGRYEDPVPPDVLKLDYLDREAQLRSEAGDRGSVPSVVDGLSATWTHLRPDVLSAGGAPVAARYDRHVRAMHRLAGTADSGLQREAGTGLELVDDLEAQFRKH